MKGNEYIVLKYKELSHVNKRIEYSKKGGEAGSVFRHLPASLVTGLAFGRLTHFSPPLACLTKAV